MANNSRSRSPSPSGSESRSRSSSPEVSPLGSPRGGESPPEYRLEPEPRCTLCNIGCHPDALRAGPCCLERICRNCILTRFHNNDNNLQKIAIKSNLRKMWRELSKPPGGNQRGNMGALGAPSKCQHKHKGSRVTSFELIHFIQSATNERLIRIETKLEQVLSILKLQSQDRGRTRHRAGRKVQERRRRLEAGQGQSKKTQRRVTFRDECSCHNEKGRSSSRQRHSTSLSYSRNHDQSHQRQPALLPEQDATSSRGANQGRQRQTTPPPERSHGDTNQGRQRQPMLPRKTEPTRKTKSSLTTHTVKSEITMVPESPNPPTPPPHNPAPTKPAQKSGTTSTTTKPTQKRPSNTTTKPAPKKTTTRAPKKKPPVSHPADDGYRAQKRRATPPIDLLIWEKEPETTTKTTPTPKKKRQSGNQGPPKPAPPHPEAPNPATTSPAPPQPVPHNPPTTVAIDTEQHHRLPTPDNYEEELKRLMLISDDSDLE